MNFWYKEFLVISLQKVRYIESLQYYKSQDLKVVALAFPELLKRIS